MADTYFIRAEPLGAAIRELVRGFGSEEGEVELVTENLIQANLSGHDSHGIGMLPRYSEAWVEGGLKPNAHIKALMDGGALLRIDGQAGFGQVVGHEAMTLAIERETRAILDWVTASPPRAGFDKVRLAGEPERESRAKRLAEGIPVDANTWNAILAAAARLKVEPAKINRLAGIKA